MSGVALLLPGQGSQYVGMGHDLANSYPSIRELYEQADEELGFSLSRLCWEGPENDLRATENAQPAILVHSFAVWSLLKEAPLSVMVGAGHSLGELSAHLIADSFSFETALRIVRRRGTLMAASGAKRPGGMAAVIGLEADGVEELCSEINGLEDPKIGLVVPANLNGPGQVVISGDVTAVEFAKTEAEAWGAKRIIPLNVSGAFHSPLMDDMAQEFSEVLAASEIVDPQFPIISNATVEPVAEANNVRRTLVSQLTSPVRWTEGVEEMSRFEPTTWLELGPGNTLSGLVRRIEKGLRPIPIGNFDGIKSFLETLSAGNTTEGEVDE